MKFQLLTVCVIAAAVTAGCARTSPNRGLAVVPTQQTTQETMQDRTQEENKVAPGDQFGMTTPRSEIVWRYDSALLSGVNGSPNSLVMSFNFPLNSSSIDEEARGALALAKQKVETDRPVADARVLVVGFADRNTEPGNAAAISRRRAEVARDQLVGLGFRAENIQIASAGSNYTSALAHERIKQTTERRVEIWLLQ